MDQIRELILAGCVPK